MADQRLRWFSVGVCGLDTVVRKASLREEPCFRCKCCACICMCVSISVQAFLYLSTPEEIPCWELIRNKESREAGIELGDSRVEYRPWKP